MNAGDKTQDETRDEKAKLTRAADLLIVAWSERMAGASNIDELAEIQVREAEKFRHAADALYDLAALRPAPETAAPVAWGVVDVRDPRVLQDFALSKAGAEHGIKKLDDEWQGAYKFAAIPLYAAPPAPASGEQRAELADEDRRWLVSMLATCASEDRTARILAALRARQGETP